MYSATFEEVAVTTSQDLFQVEVTSVNHAVLIHSISISQSSDVVDELIAIFYRVDFAFGIGTGTTLTPAPLQVGDPAFSGNVYSNASKGSGEEANAGWTQFNILQGYYKVFAPNERFLIPTWSGAGETYAFLVTLLTAPADSLTMSGTIVFEEI